MPGYRKPRPCPPAAVVIGPCESRQWLYVWGRGQLVGASQAGRRRQRRALGSAWGRPALTTGQMSAVRREKSSRSSQAEYCNILTRLFLF